jgi:hypothetical protein
MNLIRTAACLALGLALAAPAVAQDAKAWLETQNLEAKDSKEFQEFEAVIARVKGAKDNASAEERAIVFHKGKPVWQSNPKETDPGSTWMLHSIGRDLNGDGQPDVHFSSHTGANCCTTHHIFTLKPQVKRLAVYSAGSMGTGEFIEVPDRKVPVMISADDFSANAFAPYANSYFPLLILEVGPKGRMQFARDLMQSRLPGQPPPVCTQPLVAPNPWLKERCAEDQTTRRNPRTNATRPQQPKAQTRRPDEKLSGDG